MEEQGQSKEHILHGFNPATLFSKGFNLGSIDLIQGGSFREVVGRCVSALLLHMKTKDGQPAFKRAAIILPPATSTKHSVESVFADLAQAINDLRGFELDEQENYNLHKLVYVFNSPSLEVADLLSAIQEQGERHLVAVADVSQYRNHSIVMPMACGISAVRVAEDRWVPHVASICRQFVQVVKKLESYGLVHVSEVPAQNPTNVEVLTSIDDCYVAILAAETDPEKAFNLHAQAWRSLIFQGRLQEVMTAINSLGLPDGARLHALAQLIQDTGRDAEMLDVIAQLRPHLKTLTVEAAIHVAQLAHRAGDDELAQQLLPEGADDVADELWLEAGLDLATHLENNEKIALFDARLAKLFPRSALLRENRDRRLLMNCRGANSSELPMFTSAGFTSRHLALQRLLSVEQPEYEATIEEAREWGKDWLELSAICCAMHARSVGRAKDAANIASLVTSSDLYGRQATQVLLWSVKSLMLQELVPENEHDYYRNLFRAAFLFLAKHPEDHGVRLGLSTLLSVESCGDMGIPLVALTLLDLAQQGVRLARPSINRSWTRDEAVETSMKNGLAWLTSLGAAEPGVTVIPRELLVANPDDILRTIDHLVHFASGEGGKDVDLEFMKELVLLACAISPHAIQERDEDIRLLRHLASHFAIEGHFQQARNFGEAILLMGQHSAYRRRLAWQAFGDIYHRCHNHVIALIGLSCALAVDVAVERADLWHEVYTIHRVLRDLGLLELSRAFLPTMRVILSDLGLDADKDPRYVCAELGLQLMETAGTNVGPLGEILAKIAKACQTELDNRNHLFPLAMLLGQSVLKAEAARVDIPSEVQITLEAALLKIGTSMADMVRTVSTAKPRAKDVLAMFNGVERAVYASDVARDYTSLEVTARRLLDSGPRGKPSLTEIAFAIELLADHSVILMGDPPSMTLEWAVQYAIELNQAGLDVAFLAADNEGELTVIHVSNGQVSTIEQPKSERSFRHRFRNWLQDYPKDYGRINGSEGNIFYITMEMLDVRLPQAERLVLVAEPFLQQLTANLVVTHPEDGSLGHFAGTTSAIGITPSLSWLYAVRSAKRGNRTTYKAWISADTSSGSPNAAEVVTNDGTDQGELVREPTLDIALGRLSGCFEDFGFTVDTGRKLPSDMKDAGLAVVTAHGGLNREGRYLHRITDDEDLIEAPSALASALAGIEVVILFVCSGGRIDKNPWDNSTTSLTKQLLNKGSRAVIASPWPLNVMVTYNWLEPFLREWEAGATVLDATKKANDRVAQNLGEAPQYFLAMRVYGDILLTRPAAGDEFPV